MEVSDLVQQQVNAQMEIKESELREQIQAESDLMRRELESRLTEESRREIEEYKAHFN